MGVRALVNSQYIGNKEMIVVTIRKLQTTIIAGLSGAWLILHITLQKFKLKGGDGGDHHK